MCCIGAVFASLLAKACSDDADAVSVAAFGAVSFACFA